MKNITDKFRFFQKAGYFLSNFKEFFSKDVKIVPVVDEDMKKTLNEMKEISQEKDAQSAMQAEKLWIAYEPVWAIGTGKVARNEDIEETVSNIKEFVSTHYHVDLPVLYGGSVNPSNIASLEVVPNIEGYLIGGASLDPKKIEEMLKEVR